MMLKRAMSHGPTNVHLMPVSNCAFKNYRGFLVEECIVNQHKYFKCPRSDRFYRFVSQSCEDTVFSNLCPNDVAFYQACLRKRCQDGLEKGVSGFRPIRGISTAVCGDILCQEKASPTYSSLLIPTPNASFTGSDTFWDLARCDGKPRCHNEKDDIPVDEYECDTKIHGTQCSPLSPTYFMDWQICDNTCDCDDCEDEASCNNMTLGVFCVDKYRNEISYVMPIKLCDNKADCASGMDENICKDYNETCTSTSINPVRNPDTGVWDMSPRRVLTPRSKCSALNKMQGSRMNRICLDYRDQMNCTFSTISPLVCKVAGYPTTISEHLICNAELAITVPLCDDEVERQCVTVESGCIIHKHRMCDGIRDCLHGLDEVAAICNDKIEDLINCTRRWTYNKTTSQIPRFWVLDGVSDCLNDIDENKDKWTKACGMGTKVHYTYAEGEDRSDSSCRSAQLKCPNSLGRMSLNQICLGKSENCDSEICESARKDYQVVSSISHHVIGERDTKRLFYCLPGLEDLEEKSGECRFTRLSHQTKLAGVDDLQTVLPKRYITQSTDCVNFFGELYVYVACTNLCGGASCPLEPLVVSNINSKCVNYPRDQLVLSLSEDNKLGIAIEKSRSYYSKAAFACDDGNCISFDKVCNLEVDCRDRSDERKCKNNFKCEKSGEYIPLSRKCDRKFDCYDFSDECNDECTNHTVMFNHVSMFVSALLFGIIATLLNSITIVNGLIEYPTLKTENAQVNKCFVLLITLSDLLQGFFLLMLSIGDKFFNNSTCTTQFEWTTSPLCTSLGVISTIGSLLSLYSMTVLSIIRTTKMTSMKKPRHEMSRKKKIQLSITVVVLISMSFLIATLPLFSQQDYFITNLNYRENSLFVGAPDKREHVKIINSYYGRVLTQRGAEDELSWNTIRYLVREMFTKDVTGVDLGFYGSNGFCLFSYFVRSNVMYRWFSIVILTMNLVCVLVIGGCYLYVNIRAKQTAKAVKNSPSAKANRKLQRKVSIIVTTDVLTWLPFIIVCMVNYSELIDTAAWYSVFCIFFLPINSIINPIGIYDETIFNWCRIVARKILSAVNAISDKMGCSLRKEPAVIL